MNEQVVAAGAIHVGEHEEVHWLGLTFNLDTITATAIIREKRDDAKRPGAGIVVEGIEITNQHAQTVLVCEHLYLVERRPG